MRNLVNEGLENMKSSNPILKTGFILVLLLSIVCPLASAVIVMEPIGGVGSDVGYYAITSDPTGADINFDGQYQGTAPVTVLVHVSGTPGHTVSASKEGYQTWMQNIPGNPSPGETVPIFASLVPIAVTTIGGDVGWYSVSSDPSGSDVYMDGDYWGQTPATIQVFSTGTPGHTFKITHQGYNDWTKTYSTNPGAGQTVQVFASLTPIQATGSIYVTSSPSGAVATLDGTNQQSTPCAYPNVATGYHTVQVSLSGYNSYSTRVSVTNGATTNVNAYLTPYQNTGSLKATSSPSGADVYIDGTYRGDTPVTVSNIPTGNHQVNLRLAGYQSWTGSVSITSGVTTTISPTLVPSSSTTTGYILVSSNPSGASIFLDGSYQGQTVAGSDFDILNVAPGSHSIRLSLGGYQDYTTTVSVAARESVTVSATLVPSSQPSSGGTVECVSTPGGADLFMDNNYRGITPVTLPNVPTGAHTLTFRAAGYTDYVTTVQVANGQNVQITAALSPAATPTPTQSGAVPMAFIAALGCAGGLLFLIRRQ